MPNTSVGSVLARFANPSIPHLKARDADPASRLSRFKRAAYSTCLAACLLIAFLSAAWWNSTSSQIPTVVHRPSVPSQSSAAIESIRVGERVLTVSHSKKDTDFYTTAVNPETWRLLRLQAVDVWPDGTRDVIEVETLQPPDWTATRGATIGAEVPLPLDLYEMGLQDDLKARVVANEPCPPLTDGPGRIVLTTVNHLNNDVWQLDIADSQGKPQTIRPTGLHKFYSVTRDNWVSAKDLRRGEMLGGIGGAAEVRRLAPVPGIHRVYNMTVEGEHVYRVSSAGVLVHNNGCAMPLPKNPKFGTTSFGNEVHQRFDDAIISQTGTNRSDWVFNTAPGRNGVDAVFVGTGNPGFSYAELKPLSQSGFNTFQNQLNKWNLPPGQTQLWFYNQRGIIGSSGINY